MEERRKERLDNYKNRVEPDGTYTVEWHIQNIKRLKRDRKMELRAKELERVRNEEVSTLKKGKDYVKHCTKTGFADGVAFGGTVDAVTLGATEGLAALTTGVAGAAGAYAGSQRYVAKQNNRERGGKIDKEILRRKYSGGSESEEEGNIYF